MQEPHIDIFISYAREDRAMVRRMVQAFESPPGGWSVWWDEHLNTAGRFSREIRETIDRSRCVVAVWSVHSIGSDWVVAEADLGRQRGILVPVRIDSSEPPMPFGRIQSADLSGWRGSESSTEWAKLLEAVGTTIARGPEVDERERLRRKARMRAARRRRLQRRSAIIACGALVIALGALLPGVLRERAKAERLAGHAEEIRQALLNPVGEEATKKWWWRLFDGTATMEQLELSLLLAVEAVRRSNTASTRDVLADVLALLPWSDQFHRLGDDGEPDVLAFDADARLLLAAGRAGETLVLDVQSEEFVARIPHGHLGDEEWEEGSRQGFPRPQRAAFSPAEPLIATAGPDATVRLWDIHGAPLRTLTHEHVVDSVAFDADGRWLATTDRGGQVVIWEVTTGGRRHTLKHDTAARGATFSPTSRYLGTVTDSGRAQVWDLADGRVVMSATPDLPYERSALDGIVFTPDERRVLIFSHSANATLWDIAAGRQVSDLGDAAGGGAVFDTSGKTLVTADSEGLTWWVVDPARELRRLQTDYLVSVQIDRDWRVVATQSWSAGLAQVFDAATGRERQRMPYGGNLDAYALSPDGEWLATAGYDYAVGEAVLELTQLHRRDLVGYACQHVRRNLTLEEWRRYVGPEDYRESCGDLEGPDRSDPE